ncbi:MAG: hypothetical protein JSR67_07685 [Proteobacteria bacterium]|nr:hypothetical protein [Pseudomonadota bacterium]
MGQYNTLRGLKLPTSGTVDAIAAVLRNHWRAAARAPMLRRLGASPWIQGLHVRAVTLRLEEALRLGEGVHHLTRGGRLIR